MSSCKHSGEEVLDYPGRPHLEAKINKQCDEACQKSKAAAEQNLKVIEAQADNIFGFEEAKENKKSEMFDQINKSFAILTLKIEENEEDEEEVEEASKNFQEKVQSSELDEKDKEDLKEACKEAVEKNPKGFKNAVRSIILAKRAISTAKSNKISERKAAFKEKMAKVKTGLKSVGSADNIGKASVALSGAASGVSKFLSARKEDGSIDEKQVITGVIDVVDGLSAFAPAPASVVTGDFIYFLVFEFNQMNFTFYFFSRCHLFDCWHVPWRWWSIN